MTELGDEAVDARLAGSRQAPAPKPVAVESTQVVVVGLVSVASIATFKRQLGRLPGVKNVGVSSGPDGEFIFTVGHGSDTSLNQLIPTLPAFQARVVSEKRGRAERLRPRPRGGGLDFTRPLAANRESPSRASSRRRHCSSAS